MAFHKAFPETGLGSGRSCPLWCKREEDEEEGEGDAAAAAEYPACGDCNDRWPRILAPAGLFLLDDEAGRVGPDLVLDTTPPPAPVPKALGSPLLLVRA